MGSAEDKAREVQSARLDQLGDQVRDRYGITPNEVGQKPAVSNVLLTEQLLINAGFDVGSHKIEAVFRAGGDWE